MISDTKRAKGWSTAEMQGIEYVTYSVNPWVIRIEQAIRKFCIPRGEWFSKEAKFTTQALMRGDSKARVQYYKEMRLMGALNANEIRDLENRNRRDEVGDEYWIPTNIRIDDGSTDEEDTNDNQVQE
jgi:phage portal protein BeeE